MMTFVDCASGGGGGGGGGGGVGGGVAGIAMPRRWLSLWPQPRTWTVALPIIHTYVLYTLPA